MDLEWAQTRTKAGKNGSTPFFLNSFFAGIGGFDLAFQRAGVVPSYHCEKDKFCQSVLRHHWPNLQLDADVAKAKAEDLPQAHVWCGGFPCQDVSVARGSLGRDGLKGHRSGLFYAFLDLIAARLPRVVLIENVTGLLNSHQGRDFTTILKSLAALGYGVAWRVMNSRYFGAPQSRSRVFICAWHGSVEHAVQALFESLPGYEAEKERSGFLTACKDEISGISVPEVSYCLAATSGRHTGTDWSRSYVAYTNRVRRLMPRECEGLQGFPRDWTIPETFARSEEDLDTLRYHALGNAVCVPVVQWIAERISTQLQNEVTYHVKIGAVTLSERLANLIPAMRTSPVSVIELEDRQQVLWDIEPVYKWKTGGCAAQGIAVTIPVLSGPTIPKVVKLIAIIETGDVAERYFLSANAAEGILRRVKGQGRTLFGPLTAALQRLAASASQNANGKHDSTVLQSLAPESIESEAIR